ncbi:GroES-like protein [Daedaleopsis nitida]|nr:GroES-like protein [Daedaleopsis nitida]
MAPTTQNVSAIPEPHQPWTVVSDWPVQAPGTTDILVEVFASSINPSERKIQAFAPTAFHSEYPSAGGLDGAGVCEEVGSEVTTFAKGDKVFFLGNVSRLYATFKQYTVVPASIVAKIPDNVSFDEAASIPVALAIVATGLWSHHPDAESVGFPAPWEAEGTTKLAGQSALVIGGSSSIGQYAIQMAKLQGFSPIITTSLKHAPFLKSLGATHVLDRFLGTSALSAALTALLARQPLAYAFDAISEEDTQHLAYDALAPGGALVPRSAPLLQPKLARDAAPKKIAHPLASFALPANKAVGEELYKRITEWLRTEISVPNRVEVLPGGLGGVEIGSERMREGKLSGIKLIVRPQETA